nr:hypothetical protein [Tanacetum cinerariifolium]
MRTRSSSNFPVVSSNLSTSNPKRRNRRRSKQPFTLKESHVDTMADQRTMAELLRAPTEGYGEAIVVPLILAEQFELKHRAARRWLEKEPSRSIHTWEDLVSKFINEFFPPQEQQISVMKSRIFNNGGNLLERRTQDVLTIIENKSKVRNSRSKSVVSQVKSYDVHSNSSSEIAKLIHAVNQQTSDVTTAMTAMLKQFQATPPPASVKAVEETYVTCGGAHPYYQYLAVGGNTFPELRDNIQGYVSAINYNQVNPGYRPPGFNRGNNFNREQSYQAPPQQNQNVHLNELEKVRRMNEANMKAMQTQIDMVKNELRNEMKNSIQTSLPNQTNEIKNMMASLLQMNTASTSRMGSLPSNTVANPKGELKAITTRSGLVIDGRTVPTPPQSINLKVDERVEETFMDPDLAEYTIKVPPPPKMLKALLSNKEKLQELANTPLNENCSAVILKKLLKKLGDPGKFLISCGFSELKCKALADLADFVIIDYKSDPRVPLILGRPFLQTARALIDVHGEEMLLRDGDERLTLNMRHDTSSFSNQPQKESINLINVVNNSSEDFLEDLFPNQPSGNPTFLPHPELTSPKVNNDIFDSEGCNVLSEKLLDLNFTKDLHPPLHDNPLSGRTTYFSNLLLEEFANELPPKYDDNLHLKDSIDQKNLANLVDIFVDSIPEMFTNEHDLDYPSPPIFDEYDEDFIEDESDAENVYADPFDSKGEKIKESKLLIDELDIPCDFLPPSEYDSFISQDFSTVDALPLTINEDKIFNPGILIHEKPVEIITHVVQDKKLAISNASLVLEDFDPLFYEPLFFKEVPKSKMLLPFSSKNEEKVFKPGIHISEKVHSSFIPELSHQGYKVFKINQMFKSLMKIFVFYCGKDAHILAFPYHHFYPLDQFKYGGIRSSSMT